MKKLITLILFLFISQASYTQITGGSAITAGTLAWKFGLGGGFGYGFTSGILNAECAYDFENLEGPGLYINGIGSIPLNYESDFIFGLGFQFLTLSATTEMLREKAVDGVPVPVPINMASKSDIDISSLYLTLAYKQKLTDEFFVSGGLDVCFLMNCKLTQDETIKDDYVFAGSEKTNHLIYEDDLKDYNKLQLNLKVGLGYDIVIDYQWLITPNVSLSYPLLKLTPSNTLRVMCLNAGVNISYVF
jgi:hypothetical protein